MMILAELARTLQPRQARMEEVGLWQYWNVLPFIGALQREADLTTVAFFHWWFIYVTVRFSSVTTVRLWLTELPSMEMQLGEVQPGLVISQRGVRNVGCLRWLSMKDANSRTETAALWYALRTDHRLP